MTSLSETATATCCLMAFYSENRTDAPKAKARTHSTSASQPGVRIAWRAQ